MKQINLLPLDVRHKDAKQRARSILVLTFIISFGTVGTLWFFWHQEINYLNVQIVDAKNATAATTKTATAIDQSNSVDPSLLTNINQINTLSKNEISWPKLLAKTDALIPKDIRLVTVSYVSASDVTTVNMSGVAPSNLSFATFLESVKGNTAIKDYSVTNYTYDPVKGIVTFGLSIKFGTSELLYTNSSS